MREGFNDLVKAVYHKWKLDQGPVKEEHPSEEELACFGLGVLADDLLLRIKTHLLICPECMEAFLSSLAVRQTEEQEVPAHLLELVKAIDRPGLKSYVLEIVVQAREKLLELVNTTGDVLVGLELIPAPVLRSRKIREFKNEIVILKDIEDIRVEIRVERKLPKVFNIKVSAKEKPALAWAKDLRISLLKGDVELESYVAEQGKAVFEQVACGRYIMELSGIKGGTAKLLLEIRP
jgi:hypothetical protein